MNPDESNGNNGKMQYSSSQSNNNTSIEEVEYDLKLVHFFWSELIEQKTFKTKAHEVTNLDRSIPPKYTIAAVTTSALTASTSFSVDMYRAKVSVDVGVKYLAVYLFPVIDAFGKAQSITLFLLGVVVLTLRLGEGLPVGVPSAAVAVVAIPQCGCQGSKDTIAAGDVGDTAVSVNPTLLNPIDDVHELLERKDESTLSINRKVHKVLHDGLESNELAHGQQAAAHALGCDPLVDGYLFVE